MAAALTALSFSLQKKSITVERIYIQYNALCRSGQATMGGWCRMGLDDDFQIRQALPAGARFSMEKIVYYST